MRKKWKEALLIFILGLLYPSVIFSILSSIKHMDDKIATTDLTEQTTDSSSVYDRIRVLDKNTIKEYDLNQYLTAVLLEEMPVSFDMEALKAQAVVARTYTLRRYELGSKHNNADICTDPTCCQGFRSPDEHLQRGGTSEEIRKVETAVLTTVNQVLLYDGNLIDATYFSCSGGMTEDAVAVWGSEIPYLKATTSPGEEESEHYADSVIFTVKEFTDILDVTNNEKIPLIGKVNYTAGGGVDTIEICGTIFKGTQLRQKLELYSTAFTINVIGDMVTIATKGFGHRVGMSQYGAEAMAVNGYSYSEILKHYYQGIQIVEYTG